MELIGKKIERSSGSGSTTAEVTLNPVNGGIKFSKRAIELLKLSESQIGFAYDEENTGKIYLYKVGELEDEEGIKISKTGNGSSRYHSRRLMTTFEQNGGGKYTLIINTTPHTEEGYDYTFYSLAAKEAIVTEDTVTPEAVTEAETSVKNSTHLYEEVEVEETYSEQENRIDF